MKQKSISIMTIVVLFLAGIFMPVILKQYHLNMLTEIVIFSLYAVSYNLLLGYAGLLSFGHAAFFGLGAFVTAVAIIHIPGISLWNVILLGFASTVFAGLILGGLLLRHKGSYFALLTLAFNALFYAVATKWHSVTGGDDGLSITRPDLNLGFTTLPLSGLTSFYYLTLAIMGVAIVFCWYFTHTAMGKTVVLMRENEDRMKFLGYNTNISRLILFTFTGAVAGLAGVFYTFHFQFVSISAVSVDMTTAVLLMVFVGGTKTFWGPILGVFVYVIFQNYLSNITDRWPLFMGLIFVLMVLYVPGGLSGIIMDLWQRFFGKKDNNGGESAAAEEATP
ncbi:MAG TPA: branched-chain amino acid ABC transporter permease [Smithellaceae bacterium]|nr:branched-chain amino acid ABC transporter permease [Smithellaceae bacterium]HRS82861.1 branched-chain amino acid ABC transporter permease [Smithellaceae bacterium]HRV45375.1 branched-chain amino acid ABC transporter permease [Smithellaceae bacterium]